MHIAITIKKNVCLLNQKTTVEKPAVYYSIEQKNLNKLYCTSMTQECH